MLTVQKRNKILWADDDPDDRMLIREIIEEHHQDIDLTEVSNGMEILDYLYKVVQPSDLPELIILDINMPVMDGKQVLATLKNHSSFQAIPVIVFTTSNTQMDKLFCKRYNVTLITKPSYYRSLEKEVNYIVSNCKK